MKIKKRRKLHLFILIGIIFFVASGCNKEDDNESLSETNTNSSSARIDTIGKTTAQFNPNVTYGTMSDQDGNVYKTVTIGTQTWMAENLRTTKYNNGVAIPNVTDNNQWGSLTTGSYCTYKNTTNINDIVTYGRLYNWYAVNTGKLSPAGWHVPSDAEWTKLISYLGGDDLAGGKLKETGTTHWHHSGPNNSSGFTALPGGGRGSSSGVFSYLGYQGEWWSSTQSDADYSWSRTMFYNLSTVSINNSQKINGKSIRCVKD